MTKNAEKNCVRLSRTTIIVRNWFRSMRNETKKSPWFLYRMSVCPRSYFVQNMHRASVPRTRIRGQHAAPESVGILKKMGKLWKTERKKTQPLHVMQNTVWLEQDKKQRINTCFPIPNHVKEQIRIKKNQDMGKYILLVVCFYIRVSLYSKIRFRYEWGDVLYITCSDPRECFVDVFG